MDPTTEWKDIPGYEGRYLVSSAGDVFGCKHKKVLKQRLTGQKAYKQVTLYDSDFKAKTWLIHRLVALTFIPNPEKLPWVLHWDDDPWNNKVDNLRWGTGADNAQDSIRNGTRFKTHCKRGHEFTEDNTRISSKNGSKNCKVCALNHQRHARNSKLAQPWEEI